MIATKNLRIFFYSFLGALVLLGFFHLWKYFHQAHILKEVVRRLEADSRVAEVIVTKTELDEHTGKVLTTIKFLEYDAEGKPMEPHYFTFHGNVIQFQTLVIRFQDKLVEAGSRVKGKSAYLFLKAFVLDGRETQVFPITQVYEIPKGYQLEGKTEPYEEALWREFWDYALHPDKRNREGIKNAQIEAPGSLFLPGTLYTIRIEHDGGLRIDAEPIPEILRGERLV